ncbi:uncharacterized protein LTR77_008423 [Saxophila tyrrhenica]|uniref:MINDY deubiquitinase domain-containing protein n=1 Tax=Saxophila tyrrhenica TaxID=1690608 RepID=A0AAV9P0W1_9PEZI|nr:hypothetical protein LTR77_008423 [Saxophila tyrrhenica]
MVTRKPVGPPLSTSSVPPQSSNPANPPYPTTPQDSAKSTASSNSIYSADLKNSPAFDLVDVQKAQQRHRSDSDASSNGTWDSDDTLDRDHDTPEETDVPRPLNVRSSQQAIDKATKKEEGKVMLPESLRVGPPAGHPKQRTSMEGQRYDDEAQSNPWAESGVTPPAANGRQESNNPYMQRNGFTVDGSQSEWQEVKSPQMPGAAPPPVPSAAPPPPPPPANAQAPVEMSAVQSPPASEEQFQWESERPVTEHRPASWETAEILSVPQRGQSPFPHPAAASSAGTDRPTSTWWQDGPQTGQQPNIDQMTAPPYPDDSRPQSEYAPPPGPPPGRQGPLIDHEEPARPPPPGVAPIDTSRPVAAASSSAVPETPGTQLKHQRNQHYQIKHANWLDAPAGHSANSRPNMRRSPVLTQNANGPCPLLALVNALVLSTPPELDTALIETLRTREQVSLGLLLDAVFDELMSGRRGESATQLPDVGELYSFLLALHTGMNVNPRFVTPTSTPRGSLDDRAELLNGVHPTHRAQRKAGAFEETREMRLYSTFNIPLIHGWTAPADTPAYEAFVRSAQTFEDAQNIQFLEAELEDKLKSEGLPPQEQQTLQDIQTIKAFLDTWPTQLTDFGLQTISESLIPGQFAILFRNDHFSTIYKEPKHGALMTLVTDAGYASHDEIVWESLVDVNGAASEMFSGDFRVVSHNQDVRLNQGNTGGGNEGWQTVAGRNRNHGKQNSNSSLPPTNAQAPPLPGPRPTAAPASSSIPDETPLDIPSSDLSRKTSEQEDHDLALALQLQEEEEDHHRQAEQRRRREQELSEQFLSNETEGPRPAVPPRRTGGRTGGGPTTSAAAGGRTTTPSARPAVSRPADNPEDPEAPPSYEQAASDLPYRPAGSTASGSMAQGNPLGAYDALRRQSGYPGSPTSPVAGGSPGAGPGMGRRGRRVSGMNAAGQGQGQGQGMPGSWTQNGVQGQQGQGQQGRVQGAAGVKDAEERCVVM